ncbi:hypothetical protein U1Q18_039050 [Sarracenia purpurea var. burkii]
MEVLQSKDKEPCNVQEDEGSIHIEGWRKSNLKDRALEECSEASEEADYVRDLSKHHAAITKGIVDGMSIGRAKPGILGVMSAVLGGKSHGHVLKEFLRLCNVYAEFCKSKVSIHAVFLLVCLQFWFPGLLASLLLQSKVSIHAVFFPTAASWPVSGYRTSEVSPFHGSQPMVMDVLEHLVGFGVWISSRFWPWFVGVCKVLYAAGSGRSSPLLVQTFGSGVGVGLNIRYWPWFGLGKVFSIAAANLWKWLCLGRCLSVLVGFLDLVMFELLVVV